MGRSAQTPTAPPPPPQGQGQGQGQRLLLLALLPIGDTLFLSPTLRALRQRYPAAQVVALAHRNTAALLRRLPSVDEVVVLPTGPDWRGVRPLAQALCALRGQRFDVSVNVTSPAYKWVSLAAGVPRRLYMQPDWLWWLVPRAHRRWAAAHAAEHYYDCARALDLPPWSEVAQTPELLLQEEERRVARAYLAEHGLGHVLGRPLVCLHAGGAGYRGLKRWPPERFAALADRLHQQWGATCLLVGGPDEHHLAEGVCRQARSPLLNATGALPLMATFALLEASDLFVGNDSSLLHAAAAVGAPYVGIYGPTSVVSFHPLACAPDQGRVVQPQPPCWEPRSFVGSAVIWDQPACTGVCAALRGLAVDAVYQAAAALLQERRVPVSGPVSVPTAP